MELVEAIVEIEDLDGFLGELDEIAERHGVVVQGFDARYLASQRHVREAVRKAERAFGLGENVADDLGMEAMLYAAGTRQIDVATEVGLKMDGHPGVFVVVGSGDVGEAADDLRGLVGEGEVEYGDKETLMDFYGVTEEEIAAVGGGKLELLVLERVALLDVRK